MTDRPTGTISFLFSDIEGSTRRWEEDPDAMRASLAHHDRLLRDIVEHHGGFLFKHTGDGMCAAFSGAVEAAAAAVDAQRRLRTADWPGGFALKVRMGLHSGDASLVDGDYFGSAVSKTARVMDTGHGGQIVVSGVAAGLVGRALPGGTSLDDLGDHRLKDLSDPERLHQLTDAGLDTEFPALRTLELYPNNLPTQVSSFVGRTTELEELVDLVHASRLVTLTGVGGVGKTRLALQVAAEIAQDFRNGVWLVELASVADETLIPREVAEALDIAEEAHRSLVETLRDALADRELLIVLDNCEHVIDAAAKFVEDTLRAAPGIRMMVTSREGLSIPGEILWRVPSLSVRDETSDAVELFTERARQLRRDFTVDHDTLSAVRKICARLDGIPLAIELAAARLKMLRPDQIAERLDDRFRLLTGGSRTALPRQRTLQATMDWSHDLLAEHERVLLRRLSVFYGGFTLEAAEEVCPDPDFLPEYEILDLLSHLVEASLVVFDDDTGRYRLLETVRQYGLDKLMAALEGEALRRRHLAFFMSLSDRVHELLIGPSAEEWLVALSLEADNFRAAMTWSLEAGHGEDALRMAGGLGRFFFVKSMLEEALDWYARVLEGPSAGPTRNRGEALGWESGIALHAGHYERADRAAAEGIAIAESLDDPILLSHLLINQGNNAGARFETREAIRLHLKAQELAARFEPAYETVAVVNQVWSGLFLGDDDVWRPALRRLDVLHERGSGPDAWVHMARSWAALEELELDAADQHARRGLDVAKRTGNGIVAAICVGSMSATAAYRGDMDGYRKQLAETRAILREVGSPGVELFFHRTRANPLADRGEWSELRAALGEHLEFIVATGNATGLVFSALPIAAFARHVGEASTAAVLIAAQDAWLASQQGTRLRVDRERCARLVSSLRGELAEADFQRAWEAGLTMDRDEIPALIAEMLASAPHSPG